MSAPPSSAQRSYWCFISYRHADNKEPGRQWATWLHQAIETYEVPRDLIGTVNERGDTIPERIFPVFRDEEELPVDAHLASPIYRALDASKFLVVICSPRAVASTYVSSEIRYFKQLGHGDRVLAVMVEGEPNASWDAGKQAQGFKVEDECFPEAMRHHVAADGSLLSEQTEPIAADFRLDAGSQGWTSIEAYRLALRREGLNPKAVEAQVQDYRRKCELMKLKVIAGILGVALGVLTERDKTHQLALAHKRARTLRRWLAAVGLLAVLAILGGGLAYVQKKEANKQRAEAISARDDAEQQKAEAISEKEHLQESLARSDFLQAEALLKQGRIADALLYLARSLRTQRENNPAAALAFSYLPLMPTGRAVFQQEGASPTGFSPDGKRVVTISGNTARVWDVQTGQPVSPPLEHQDRVNSASFSPNGNWVATACNDNTARVWDASSGKVISPPLAHQTEIPNGYLCPTFSPDESYIATASASAVDYPADEADSANTVQVWNTQTWQPISKPLQPKALVTSMAFSPEGKRLLTTAYDDSGRIWNVVTGQLTAPILEHRGFIFSGEFSPNGKWIVTASKDHTAQVWDAKSSMPVSAPLQHKSTVLSATFSPDGKWVVTASDDTTARVWEVKTGRPISPPLEHQDSVLSARFSPDGQWVVTASDDKTARLWNAQTGQLVSQPLPHGGSVLSASFSTDGQQVLTFSSDGTARTWNFQGGQSLETLHQDFFDSANLSPDGKWLVSISNQKTIQVWDTQTGKIIAKLQNQDDLSGDAIFSPDGKRVLTIWPDADRVWDVQTGRAISPPIPQEAGASLDASFSPDGSRVLMVSDEAACVCDSETGKPIATHSENGLYSASFSPDGKLVLTVASAVRIWNAQNGQSITTLQSDARVDSAHFSPNGKWVLMNLGGPGQGAWVWNAQTGKPIAPLPDGPSSASFSPKGKWILTVPDDGTAQIWDAETGKPFASLQPGDKFVSASFSPDEKVVTTVAKSVRIWDTQTGKPIATLQAGESVDSSSFSPDGQRVLTVSGDVISNEFAVRIWNSQSGKSISTLQLNAMVNTASFSPDGKWMLTVCQDGAVRLWDVQTGQPLSPPLQQQEKFYSAIFSPTGQQIVATSDRHTTRAWDIAPETMPPDWLPDVLEAYAFRYLDEGGAPQMYSAKQFNRVRQERLASTSNEPWEVFGRWLFSDPDSRTVSPWSLVDVPEYVQRLIAEDSTESLSQAEQLSYGHPDVLAQIAAKRAALASPAPAGANP